VDIAEELLVSCSIALSPVELARLGWIERLVRRYRLTLAGVVGLFVVLQGAARAGLVPHLQPVQLGEVMSDMLLAAAFGAPFIYHLGSLPRIREILATLGLAALLIAGLGSFQSVGEAQVVFALGVASSAVLLWRTWASSGWERTRCEAYLLPALITLVLTFLIQMAHLATVTRFPLTQDAWAYAADAGFGSQWSFTVGQCFKDNPSLAGLCEFVYLIPPAALLFVHALQIRAPRPPARDVLTVLTVLLMVGYLLYFLMPVGGPRATFGDAFPSSPPPAPSLSERSLDIGSTPRNGMPSLHLGAALLSWWHVRPYGLVPRLITALLGVFTVLATLGLGEHYLVDLVVAIPVTLAVQAACMPQEGALGRVSRMVFLGSALLVAGWYALLFHGVSRLDHPISIICGFSLATVTIVVWLEWRLRLAAEHQPGPLTQA
jgi:hypothetical protein